MVQLKSFKFSILSVLGAMFITGIGGCKQPPTRIADTESAASRSSSVYAFVTRENNFLDSSEGRKHIISMAARIGLKGLFVDVWSRGCTLFHSNVMKTYGGPEICSGVEGDALSELMRYGKILNVKVVPWFEWGNILPASSELWRKNSKSRGWKGFGESFHSVPSVRINPYEADFDDFFAALLKETVTRYNAQEIHICDNFAPHTKTGEATKIKGARTFTSLTDKVTKPARTAGALISLSSQRRLNSLETFSIDWGQWRKSGIVTDIYPQLYHVKEDKIDQFRKEASEEKQAGARGVALYSGPSEAKWTLEGLGRFVKLARSMNLTSVLFDFNTLLTDQKVSSNVQVKKVAAALGTIPRLDLPALSTGVANPKSTGGQTLYPPAPVLPPPPSANAPVSAGASTPSPVMTKSTSATATPTQAPQPSGIAANPTTKKICAPFKIGNAPDNGVPTYLSPDKTKIFDSAAAGDILFRHSSQKNSFDGEDMSYVTLYTADGSNPRVRWLQSKYLAERPSEDYSCPP